jgi:hypothetical protein
MSSLAEFMPELWRAAIVFVYALLFAFVEIEIEGEHGWAERLPTWYRVTPRYARVFIWATSGKPLTGYHLLMIPLAFLSFHLGFAFGQPWSATQEVSVVALFMFWFLIWDFLWFLFNPHFGWKRFRPGQVWWLGKRWLGPFPLEYWHGLLLSVAVAALPWLVRDNGQPLLKHAITCALLLAATAASALFVPAYHRWYRHMRREGADERSQVPRR